uniref:Fe2OG dioxygenase domain-containing protein n=1 Tax=Eutreptiella gymnastica TaxID=73025 RepID=A0A7S4G1S8_9EUGL
MAQVVEGLPDSLAYARVDAATVASALQCIESLPTYSWGKAEGAGSLSRKTINFGWDFVGLERGEKTWIEFPEEIATLRDAVVAALAPHAPGPGAQYDNVIVSIYGPGEGLQAHFDRDERADRGISRIYYFGEQVLGVVLVPDEEGHLQYQHHPAKGEKPPPDSPVLFALPEEVGTCFCMQGQVRHWPYYHSVSAVAQKRVSLTIRTTHFHPPPPSADAPVPPLNTAGVTASGTGDHAEGGSPRDPPSPRPSPTTGLTGDEEIGCVCAIL